jgi:hypothetical protein
MLEFVLLVRKSQWQADYTLSFERMTLTLALQEAADLILLSNFSAIITGIQYGRLCFENLRKSILYLLPAGQYIWCQPHFSRN